MLDMEHAWWEFVLRAIAVYSVLLLLVKLSGKRTVGQFTPFDLLVVLLMSEAVGDSLGAGDPSLPGGLIAATTLVALNLVMAVIASRSRRAEDIIEGSPVLIARDGRLLPDALRANHVGRGDWEKALREADAELADVRRAFLEADGNISILKKKTEST